jgi:ABC-type sugar transport system substrate-binding protein
MRVPRLILLLAVLFAVLAPSLSFADPYDDKWIGVEAEDVYPWGTRAVEAWERVFPKKKLTIGVSIPSLESPYFVNQVYGYLTEAQATGVGITVLAAHGYEDLQGQINQIENLMNRRVDALVVAVISAEGVAAITERAAKRGIPVYFIGEAAIMKDLTGYVCENDFDFGYKCVDWLGAKMNGRGKIAILAGPAGNTYTETINKGAHAALKKYPNLQLVAEKWTDSEDPALGQATAENILNGNPDLNAFFVVEAQAHGVANALKERNLQDKVLLSVAYPFQETIPYIRDGSIDYGVTGYSLTNARILINMIIRNANGEKRVPKYVWTPGLEMTKEAIASFPRWHVWAPEGWQPPSRMTLEYRKVQ